MSFHVLTIILPDVKKMLLCALPGAFFCINMVLITLSSFLSATIINLYMRADKKNKVPDWLRMVGYVFCTVQ